ncbi:MAG TPA: hypothetical protein VJY65_08915, partial [Chloroflexota bacterium]|nr:hypothetical protein [Chloroflexota bacterium]
GFTFACQAAQVVDRAGIQPVAGRPLKVDGDTAVLVVHRDHGQDVDGRADSRGALQPLVPGLDRLERNA